MEQELGNIAKFVYDTSGVENIYFNSLPESFKYPSIYFPVPEINARGDTTSAYAFEYVWRVHFFDSSSQGAYDVGFKVLKELKGRRNLIPQLVDESGEERFGLRVKDLVLSQIDNGVVELKIEWNSFRYYDDDTFEKAKVFFRSIITKSGTRVNIEVVDL